MLGETRVYSAKPPYRVWRTGRAVRTKECTFSYVPGKDTTHCIVRPYHTAPLEYQRQTCQRSTVQEECLVQQENGHRERSTLCARNPNHLGVRVGPKYQSHSLDGNERNLLKCAGFFLTGSRLTLHPVGSGVPFSVPFNVPS